MRGLWRSMKDGIDKDFAKYREKSEKAAASANARWGKAAQASSESEMQSNANASEKMQTHLTECDGMHSHRTYTDICTCTATATPEAPAAAADSRIDPDLAEIVQHFQQVIGVFPRSALDKLQRYRDSIPAEVICLAFDEAAESGHRSWKYVSGILKSWQADGVRTLGDVEARREARRKPEPPQEKKMEVLT